MLKPRYIIPALILLAAFFVAPVTRVHADTVGNQQVVTLPYDYNNSQTSIYGLLSLPADYNSSSQSYPLLIFAHGTGEAGSSESNLSKLYTSQNAGGPSYYIAQGTFPTSFTNPADGKPYSFIVLSPQAGSWAPQSTESLDEIVQYMVQHYRVDTNRIYLTGLSLGGGQVVYYTEDQSPSTDASGTPIRVVPKYPAAAIVPMSAAARMPSANDVSPIVTNKVHIWGFGSPSNDYWGAVTQGLANTVNAASPGLARFTTYTSGHTGWGNFYNPNYKETINGVSMNIYQWMLQYTRANTTIPSPTVNAGADQTVTAPTNSATLTGTATAPSGLSITATVWTQVSGPTTAALSFSTNLSTTAANLIAGTYVFKLSAVSSNGATGSDTVTITVTAPTTSSPPVVATEGNESVIRVPTDPAGSTDYALLSLPQGYDPNSSTKYPLLVFLHGSGEVGNSPTSLSELYTSQNAGGPSYYIAQGTFPTSFTNPADGKQYQFIVLSPQASWFSPSPQSINDILPYMVHNYNVDTNRIYLTGLSAGGENLISYTVGDIGARGYNVSYLPAAIVPMSASIYHTPSVAPPQWYADTTIAEGIRAWGFGGTSDQYGVHTIDYVNDMGTYGRATPYPGGHTGWGNYYNPNYTETINGVSMNIYQWMLQYTRANLAGGPPASGGSTSNTPPTVSAGSNQTITLPTSSVALSGTATAQSGATLSTYAWTEVSGPVTATIASPTSASTNVSGLSTAGTYSFKLTVTDSRGSTNTATVTITVQPASVPQVSSPYSGTPIAIPGTVQAEDYDLGGQGVAYNDSTTGDSGSGFRTTESVDVEQIPSSSNPINYDIGWTTAGEWTNYTVNVASAGTYTVVISASAPSSGSSVQLSMDGTALTTITIPQTGSYQTYANTAPVTVSLSAGKHLLRVYDTTAGFNLDSFTFSQGTQVQSNTPPTVSAGSSKSITLPTSSVTLSGTATAMSGASIVSTTWTEQSGPATVTFANANALSTTASGLTAAGTYVFKLAARDSNGLTAADNSMQVVVSPANNSQTNTNSGSNYAGQNTSTDVVGTGSLTLTITPGQTFTMPNNYTSIYATTSISYASFGLKQVSGPTQATVTFYGGRTANIEDLSVGTYVFQAHASSNGNTYNAYATTTVTILPDTTQPGDVSFTANTYVPTPTEPYGYGTNTGYYPGTPWLGNPLYNLITMLGGHSTRTSLPDSFVSRYGTDANLSQFQYFAGTLGFQGNVVFISDPSSDDQSTTTYNGTRSKLWKGMYDPIWSDGSNGDPVNPNNTLAQYVYDLVRTYGPDIKYWEIINEPDFTYATADASNGPTAATNWWTQMPSPTATTNLDAPVTAYVRVLRVAYEVIKKYDPNSLVCPGGLGYPSYLDAILRYTDNPNGGTVTSQYPLTGGAYMDCLSWHIYPEYRDYSWEGYNAPGNINGFKYSRYSDYIGVTAFQDAYDSFQQVMQKYGYGTTYPAKVQIVTENGIASRQVSTGETGGVTLQKNFTIKASVQAQRMGLSQMYWYGFAGPEDDGSSSTSSFDLMNLIYIEDASGNVLTTPLLTESGVANLTMSKLLYGWKYDAAQSAKLQLPSNLDGAAFSNNGQYRYVLWAKTTTDNSEDASGSYSFPASLGISSLKRVEWNYSQTAAVTTIGPSSIALTGSPSFFIPANQTLPTAGNINAWSSNTSSTGSTSTTGNTSGNQGTNTSGNSGGNTNTSSSNGGSTGNSGATSGGSTNSGGGGSSSATNSGGGGGGSVAGNTSGTGGSSTNQQSQGNGEHSSVTITTPVLRVRKDPNGTVLGTVNEGDQGTVISTSPDGSWLQVQFPTFTGYVYKQYTAEVPTSSNNSGGGSSGSSSSSSSSNSSSTSASTGSSVAVTTPVLNVRSTPGGSVVGHVTSQNVGTVLWQSPATPWMEVQFDNGLSGFVYNSYVASQNNESTSSNSGSSSQQQTTTPSGGAAGSSTNSSTSSVIVTTSSLHVRNTPNGSILGLVHSGDHGTLVSASPDGSWLQVQFPTFTGYVYKQYTQTVAIPSTGTSGGTGSTSTTGTAPVTSGTTSASTTATLVYPNTSKLNVRSTPNGTVIGKVTPQNVGTVLWQSPATPWMEVQFDNGLSGFVYGTYLSGTNNASSTVPEQSTSSSSANTLPAVNSSFSVGSLVTVNVNKLHVRETPNGTVLGTVTEGEQGAVSAVSGAWVQVSFPSGLTGYVYGSYIQ